MRSPRTNREWSSHVTRFWRRAFLYGTTTTLGLRPIVNSEACAARKEKRAKRANLNNTILALSFREVAVDGECASNLSRGCLCMRGTSTSIGEVLRACMAKFLALHHCVGHWQ